MTQTKILRKKKNLNKTRKFKKRSNGKKNNNIIRNDRSTKKRIKGGSDSTIQPEKMVKGLQILKGNYFPELKDDDMNEKYAFKFFFGEDNTVKEVKEKEFREASKQKLIDRRLHMDKIFSSDMKENIDSQKKVLDLENDVNAESIIETLKTKYDKIIEKLIKNNAKTVLKEYKNYTPENITFEQGKKILGLQEVEKLIINNAKTVLEEYKNYTPENITLEQGKKILGLQDGDATIENLAKHMVTLTEKDVTPSKSLL